MSVAMPYAQTRGVVFVHSTPAVLCPHIQWALEAALGTRVQLDWVKQPAAPGLMRMEFTWHGPAGTGARITSAFRGWENMRYEVTEDASPGNDGSRWSHTPSLGIHHAKTSVTGDVMVGEDHLREVVRLAQGSPEAFAEMVDELLGKDWDAELEPFRHAGEGAPVRWLHKVG